MGASNWFGDLQLAYKYIVVFLSLLVLTIIAGFIKVLYNRRRLKQHVKKEELEAGPREDQVELNQREKDEGDLFGIRAIEAGFYAGVHQSRPTSRAGSVVDHPAMSSSTLVGGVNSPLMKNYSNNTSVLSLNLGANENNARRQSPPNGKLLPSEAELTGRHGAVDMSLQVPPSPGQSRGASPQPFSGVDSNDATPQSMSPRSANFPTEHYAPTPKNPMPDALQVTYHDGDRNQARSQAASFNSSPLPSPTPPSPGDPPATKLPTIPTTALRKESRSPSPEYYQPPVRIEHSTTEALPTSPPPHLPALSFETNHKRGESDASSIYSENRLSTFSTYLANQKRATRSSLAAPNDSNYYGYPSMDGTITSSTESKEGDRKPGHASTFLTPSAAQGNGSRLSVQPSSNESRLSVMPQGNESRLSEFYDAYYRNSQIAPLPPVEVKRTHNERQSTIMEVDTPMASPMLLKPVAYQPGVAM